MIKINKMGVFNLLYRLLFCATETKLFLGKLKNLSCMDSKQVYHRAVSETESGQEGVQDLQTRRGLGTTFAILSKPHATFPPQSFCLFPRKNSNGRTRRTVDRLR